MIDILIINYNCVNDLAALLEALTKWDKPVYSRRAEYSITVVDNGSTDGSAEIVTSQFPKVQLIARAENGGYSAAVNEGIAATKNSEILLLNSDILLTPAVVAGLVRIWERLDYPGIVAPLHIEPDGFPQLTWGAYPTAAAEARRKKLERGLEKRQLWAKKAVLAECCATRKVDWVSGSCLFFSRRTVDTAGLWDTNFFLYFEDIDWCLRVRNAGLAIYHTAEMQVRHQHGASMNANPVLTELEYRRSQCYFIKKYFGAWRLLQLRIYLSFKQMSRWILGRRSGFNRPDSLEILKQIWQIPGAE